MSIFGNKKPPEASPTQNPGWVIDDPADLLSNLDYIVPNFDYIVDVGLLSMSRPTYCRVPKRPIVNYLNINIFPYMSLCGPMYIYIYGPGDLKTPGL